MMHQTTTSRTKRPFGRRERRRLLVALALLTAIGCLVLASEARALTRDDLFKQLGVDVQPADYIVLVDTSKSMAESGRYSEVRSRLAAFLTGTSPSDHVAVYTFDDVVQPRYVGQGGAPDDIVAHLPAGPRNGQTDIGSAIESALEELERLEAAPVGSIVLLTDGNNNPLDDSLYRPTGGPAWSALTARAKKLTDAHHTLRGYALPLGSDANGAALLRQVLPTTSVVNPSDVPDIGGFLDRTKESIRAEKAKTALSQDIGRGATVVWPDRTSLDLDSGAAVLTFKVQSRLAKVPIDVTNMTVKLTDAAGVRVALDPTSPRTITLAPGESREFKLHLTWSPGAGPVPYRRTRKKTPEVQVLTNVSSPWTPMLAPAVRLGIPRTPAGNTREIELRDTVGKAWVLPVVVLALLLLAGLLWMHARRRAHPSVSGTLQLERLLSDDRQTVDVSGNRATFAFPSHDGISEGRGRITTTRLNGGGVGLAIIYSPDGSLERESTETLALPSGQVTLGRVRFSYIAREDQP